jgi:HSP20 family protein
MAQSETKGQAQGQGAQGPARAGETAPARFEQDPFAWHPMSSVRRIFDDFDRLFEDIQRGAFGRSLVPSMRNPFEGMLAPTGLSGGGQAAPWAPRIELRDTGREYVVSAELPGVDPKDVQVEATDEGLILRGEMRQDRAQEEGGVWRSERRYGSFFRQVPLPPDLIDADKAQAEFKNGLLTVRLPKTEAGQQRVRRIQVVGAEPLGGGQQATGSGQQGAAGGQAGEESRKRSG